jgi:hypothetical protein
VAFGVAAALADNSVLKQILVLKNLPQQLALHCVNEYSQLAAFLPEVYGHYAEVY